MITLGSNTVGIGLVLRLRDQFSAQANRISNQFNRLYGNANRAFKQNLSAARQVGFAMMIAGLSGVTAFTSAIKAASEFKYTLSGVQAVLENVTGAQMKGLHQQAIAIGMSSKFTANQVASAAEQLAKSGFRYMDIRKSLQGVANLGAAADINIEGKEGAAGIMSNILNTFGLRASQATRVADVMAMTAVKSQVDILDLAESIKYAGSIATTLKIPFEDLNAMLGVLGNSGQRGSMAGVGLANALMYLSKASGPFRTKRQADALAMLGINPNELIDAKGNLKDMLSLTNVFRKGLMKLPETRQVSILEGLMNIRGARAFVPFMRETEIGMSLAEMLTQVRDRATGASKAMSDIRMNTLQGDLDVLKDTWHAFKVTVGETLEPLVRMGAKFATKVLGAIIKFANTPFGKPIIILTAGLSLAVTIAGTLLVAFTSIKLLTIASSVSFANMGRSLVWAWTAGNAAALRYMTTAQGAMLVGGPTGARWRNIATGRFQKGPKGAMLAGGGLFATIRKFFMKLIPFATRGVGGLGKAMFGFTRFGGLLLTAVVAMVGFRNVLKALHYGFGTLLHSLMFIADYVSNLNEGPIDAYGIAKDRFVKRNNAFRESLGFQPMEIERVGRANNLPYANTSGLKEQIDEIMAKRLKGLGPKINPSAAVYMDGKKVGNLIEDHNRRNLQKWLEVTD